MLVFKRIRSQENTGFALGQGFLTLYCQFRLEKCNRNKGLHLVEYNGNIYTNYSCTSNECNNVKFPS